MSTSILTTRDALHVWQALNQGLLSHVSVDLSARQSGILLAVYLSAEPQTIRGLAERLRISKPAVCRAVDALTLAGLVKRLRDSGDRRNVIVRRTLKGTLVLSEMAEIVASAVSSVETRREGIAA